MKNKHHHSPGLRFHGKARTKKTTALRRFAARNRGTSTTRIKPTSTWEIVSKDTFTNRLYIDAEAAVETSGRIDFVRGKQIVASFFRESIAGYRLIED